MLQSLKLVFFPFVEKPNGDDWFVRYQMIRGICQGLQYLHDKLINHLDLKPENVMLDAHMEPKITDFGLSRCLDQGQSKIITQNICGTR
jgi:serine/threonine protein kinase